MLEKDKITGNAAKFFKTGETYSFMTEELMTFLGAGFIGAPASTMTSLHNAFEGGLIDHLLRTTAYAVKINKTLPEHMQVSTKSIITVGCLFQIGKAHSYTPCKSDWHRKNQGKMYEFVDQISMRIGERSVMYATQHGVELTEEEYQAIFNFDKEEDAQAKWHSEPLSVILKQANELAIMEEKINELHDAEIAV